jgi:hypothetical protein
MSQHLEDVITLYKKTLLRNLAVMNDILNNVPEKDKIVVALESLFVQAQEYLIGKWRTEKKYLRTVSALRAIPNYPKHIMGLSLTLDATVNILDDLLDENLAKEEKALYIVEIIRLMSNFVQTEVHKEVRDMTDLYYHKLISIAVLEKFFYDGMKKSKTIDEILINARGVTNMRSTDMDIFLQIPLFHADKDKTTIDNIVRLGRIFRCLNLIKKDLDDYDHDVAMNIDTIYTILSKNKIKLLDSVKLLVNSYMEDLKEFERNSDTANLFEMIESEKLAIQRKLEKFISN